MAEMRGLLSNGSTFPPSRHDSPSGGMLDRNLERVGNRAKVRGNGHVGRSNRVIATIVLATLLLSAALILPGSLSSDAPDRAISVTPLGTIGDVSWTNMSPPSPPAPRNMGALVYDYPTGTYVLYGGVDADDNTLTDTWSYDYGANSWQNKSPADHPYTLWPCYAYDPVDEAMLMYPCVDPLNGTFSETWWYDASANEWNNPDEGANAPSLRVDCAAAYDSQSDKFVIFGGIDYWSLTFVNETWAYDFTTNSWTNMTPKSSPPPAYAATMVYDSESDRIIMFGGMFVDPMGDASLMNTTWSYDIDSNTWTNITSHSGPSERFGACAVYDPVSDLVLSFGGMGYRDDGMGGLEQALFDDLWAYDYNSDTWSEVSQLTRPTARVLGSMAIDPWTRVVVLYGGMTGDPSGESDPTYLDDTWAVQLGTPIPEFDTVVLPAVGAIFIVTALAGLNGRRHCRR